MDWSEQQQEEEERRGLAALCSSTAVGGDVRPVIGTSCVLGIDVGLST